MYPTRRRYRRNPNRTPGWRPPARRHTESSRRPSRRSSNRILTWDELPVVVVPLVGLCIQVAVYAVSDASVLGVDRPVVVRSVAVQVGAFRAVQRKVSLLYLPLDLPAVRAQTKAPRHAEPEHPCGRARSTYGRSRGLLVGGVAHRGIDLRRTRARLPRVP